MCDVIICYVLCGIILYHIISVLCHVKLCYAVLCNVTLCGSVLCHIVLWRTILCHGAVL